MNIEVLYVDNPYVAGFLDKRKWAGQYISYSGRQIFKLHPEYFQDFSKEERQAIRDHVMELANADYLIAQPYTIKESNGENMKKRISILEALNKIPEISFINEMTKDPKNISKRNFSKQVFRDRHFGGGRQYKYRRPEDRIGIGRNVYLDKDPKGENVLPGGNEQDQAVFIPRTDALATDYDHEFISDMDFFDTEGDYYGEDLSDYDSYYDDYESGYAKPEQDAGVVPVPGFDDTEDLNESYNWSKFVKDLAKRERKNTLEAKQKRINENSPQREYNKRYREDWRNSTRWTK